MCNVSWLSPLPKYVIQVISYFSAILWIQQFPNTENYRDYRNGLSNMLQGLIVCEYYIKFMFQLSLCVFGKIYIQIYNTIQYDSLEYSTK